MIPVPDVVEWVKTQPDVVHVHSLLSEDDLKQIEAELADVYGPLPDEAKLLLDIGELRIAASKWDLRSIVASGNDLVFSFREEPGRKVNTLFATVRGSVRIPDPKTVNLRLSPSYFEPRTLVSLLRKVFAAKSR